MSLGTVCRCCGEKIQARANANPNICLSCAQLLEDNSPLIIARETDVITSDALREGILDERGDFSTCQRAHNVRRR